MLAEPWGAEELLNIGYLDKLVAPETLGAAVQALAASLLTGAALALAGMKLSLNEIARGDIDLPRLLGRVERCTQSEDLHHGLAAIGVRRMPRFRGR